MPTTYYHTVNGRIIGQSTGATRTDYLTDALGSVTATVNAAGNVMNTYRYKPSGAVLSSSGAGTEPRFRWTGDTGSRHRAHVVYAQQYNRARHYGQEQGQWTSVDPLWPEGSPYGYANSNPVDFVDPSGKWSIRGRATCDSVSNATYMNRWCGKLEPRIYAKGDITGKATFCNAHLDYKACPVYSAGMTGAWPHMVRKSSGHVKECCQNGKWAESKCQFPDVVAKTQDVPQMGCGDLVIVAAQYGNKTGFVIIKLIDHGPAGLPRANAVVDLHPQAAKSLAVKLGMPKKYQDCLNFAVESVTVSSLF